jgi:hypothetical protein
MDKKKFQLEFFTQFVEEKNLQEKWDKFKDENRFELAKIFRKQAGIRELYSEFLVDTLGINPVSPEMYDYEKPNLSTTEMNILLQSTDGQAKLRRMGYLKDEQK